MKISESCLMKELETIYYLGHSISNVSCNIWAVRELVARKLVTPTNVSTGRWNDPTELFYELTEKGLERVIERNAMIQ